MRTLSSRQPGAIWKIAPLAAVAFFILGYACIWLSREAHDVSIFWVATAFATCVVLRLCSTTKDMVVMFGAFFVAGLCANLLGGSSWPLAIAFSLINMVDAVVARLLVQRSGNFRFLSFASAMKFLVRA